MSISELTTYSAADCQDLDALMHELSPTSFCNEKRLQAIVNDPNAHLFVVRDNDHIVGSACLCVAHSTEFTLGFIESVVVSESHRGQHLGRLLMEHILSEAKTLKVESLHLTSNPKRIAANALYKAIGFTLYETNVYKLEIKQ